MNELSFETTAELHRLMSEAAARYNSDDIQGAEQTCLRVLALSANFAPALHLLGLCQWSRGDLGGAENSIHNALRQHPDDAQMLHDLGGVYSSQGRWMDAANAYLQAIERRPDYAESYINLGAVYEYFEEHDNAERAYRQALALNPRAVTALASLAALCESGNHLEEAVQLVQAALELDPDDEVANLTRAQLDFRAERYPEAVRRLELLLQQTTSPRNRSLGLARMGAACEMLGQYDRAFEAFRNSKEALNTGSLPAHDSGIYSSAVCARISRCASAMLSVSRVGTQNGETPVFLVGFPRSGTTLLDQMLSAHPGLVVLEERENLRDLLQDFVSSDAALERFTALQPDELQNYRNKYWKRVAESLPQRPAGSLFVDKLPLNTMFMPLIAGLFPAARFIFAIRDPRDVVLSCFMRAFSLTEAMRNFLSLESTARYYSAVMTIGADSLRHLNQSAHLMRYETLVEDVEGEAHRLCEFVGVAWNDAMLKFHETARKRRINTPSYHQVVRPIYKSARQRWRNYEHHLQPILPMLQPFLDRFAYK